MMIDQLLNDLKPLFADADGEIRSKYDEVGLSAGGKMPTKMEGT